MLQTTRCHSVQRHVQWYDEPAHPEVDHHQIIRLIQEHPELAKCSFKLRFSGYVPFQRKYIHVLPLLHVCQAYCPTKVIQRR